MNPKTGETEQTPPQQRAMRVLRWLGRAAAAPFRWFAANFTPAVLVSIFALLVSGLAMSISFASFYFTNLRALSTLDIVSADFKFDISDIKPAAKENVEFTMTAELTASLFNAGNRPSVLTSVRARVAEVPSTECNDFMWGHEDSMVFPMKTTPVSAGTVVPTTIGATFKGVNVKKGTPLTICLQFRGNDHNGDPHRDFIEIAWINVSSENDNSQRYRLWPTLTLIKVPQRSFLRELLRVFELQ